MKVKNLWVSYITSDQIEKMVIVKECSLPRKILKQALNYHNNEYNCVFTKKRYYFGMNDITHITMFLDVNQMKANINKKELKQFYLDKEEEIKLKLLKKTKNPIGFNK